MRKSATRLGRRLTMVGIATIATVTTPGTLGVSAASPAEPDQAVAGAERVHRAEGLIVANDPPGSARCNFAANDEEQVSTRVCFEAAGDRIWVLDDLADGHHSEFRGIINGKKIQCYTTLGDINAWARCDDFWDNIPEHDEIEHKAKTMEGKRVIDESSTRVTNDTT